MGHRLIHIKHHLSRRSVDRLPKYIVRSEFEGEEPSVHFRGKGCQVLALDRCDNRTLRSLLRGQLPSDHAGGLNHRRSEARRADCLRIRSGSVAAYELLISLDKANSEIARRNPRWDAATTRVFERFVENLEECIGARLETAGKKIYVHTGRAVIVIAKHELSREHEPQKHWHIYIINLTPRDGTGLSYAVDRTAILPNFGMLLELANHDLKHEAVIEGVALDERAAIQAVEAESMLPISTRRAQILDATGDFPPDLSLGKRAAKRQRSAWKTRRPKQAANRASVAADVDRKLGPDVVHQLNRVTCDPIAATRIEPGANSRSRIAALTAAAVQAAPDTYDHLSRFGLAAAVCRAGGYAFTSRAALQWGAPVAVQQSGQSYPWCISRSESTRALHIRSSEFTPEEYAQAASDFARAKVDFCRVAWEYHRRDKVKKVGIKPSTRDSLSDFLRERRGGRPGVPPVIQLAGPYAKPCQTIEANRTCRELARSAGLLHKQERTALLASILADEKSGVHGPVPVGAQIILTARDGHDRAGRVFGIDCHDGAVSLVEYTPGWKPQGSGTCVVPPGLLPKSGFVLIEPTLQNLAAGDRITPLTRHKVTLVNGEQKSVYTHRAYTIREIDSETVMLSGIGRLSRAELPRWSSGWCMRAGKSVRGARVVTDLDLKRELQRVQYGAEYVHAGPTAKESDQSISAMSSTSPTALIETSTQQASVGSFQPETQVTASPESVNASVTHLPQESINALVSDPSERLGPPQQEQTTSIVEPPSDEEGRSNIAPNLDQLITSIFSDAIAPNERVESTRPSAVDPRRMMSIGCHKFAAHLSRLPIDLVVDPAHPMLLMSERGLVCGYEQDQAIDVVPLGTSSCRALLDSLDAAGREIVLANLLTSRSPPESPGAL